MKDWINKNKSFLVLLSLVLVIRFTHLFAINIVQGESMMPTYRNFEILVGSSVMDIERGDIVVAVHDNKKVIKRVIGLPLDTIKYVNSTLIINGEIYEEPYIVPERNVYSSKQEWSITLKDDEYLILGDNRDNSYDGRYYGAIKKDDILEKIYSTGLNPLFWFSD